MKNLDSNTRYVALHTRLFNKWNVPSIKPRLLLRNKTCELKHLISVYSPHMCDVTCIILLEIIYMIDLYRYIPTSYGTKLYFSKILVLHVKLLISVSF